MNLQLILLATALASSIAYSPILSSNELQNQNIENLSLAHNRIGNVSPEILQRHVGLIHLDLSYNDIAALDDDLFADLEKLQTIRISYNQLTDISR